MSLSVSENRHYCTRYDLLLMFHFVYIVSLYFIHDAPVRDVPEKNIQPWVLRLMYLWSCRIAVPLNQWLYSLLTGIRVTRAPDALRLPNWLYVHHYSWNILPDIQCCTDQSRQLYFLGPPVGLVMCLNKIGVSILKWFNILCIGLWELRTYLPRTAQKLLIKV